jgi:PAS domain S-box-containing protein
MSPAVLDSVIVIDGRGRIVDFYPLAEAALAHRREDVVGCELADVISAPALRETDRAELARCLREASGGSARQRVELHGVRADGSECAIELTLMATAGREQTAFTGYLRELTEPHARQAASYKPTEDLAREPAARQQVEALGDLAEELATALTEGDVARVAVDRGRRVMGADTCTLYGADGDDGALVLIEQQGVAPELVDQIRRIDAASGNPLVRTVATGEALWVETEADYAAMYPALALRKVDGSRARSFWSIPLVVESKAIGLLGMGFFAERRMPDAERTFALTFARHCAQALRRAQLVRQERKARSAAELAYHSLQTTLKSIGDGVIVTDTSACVTFLNPCAERLTGWTAEEAQGKPIGAVFHIINEHTHATVESPIETVLREGVVVGLANHTLLVRKDGQHLPIDDSGAPIRDDSGQMSGAVVVFRDVSVKRKAEQRRAFLAEATSILAASLDYEMTLKRIAELAVPSLADWCVVDIVEPSGSGSRQLAVAHMDPAKVELARELRLRYPPSPDASSGVPNVLRTRRSELHVEISEQLLERAAVDDDHLRILRQLELRSAMEVPLIARGDILGVISFVYAGNARRYSEADLSFAEDLAQRAAVAIDNTRLYAAEQHARKAADIANHAKDEFLATVSHELRTPLNAILGWANLMSAGGLDEHKIRRAIETIERNATAMAQLIEDLLDVSRIISGKLRIDVQPVDVTVVARAALESLAPAAAAKNIRVREVLANDGVQVMGDPTRIQQVFWNLLSNAVKFTSKGGYVDIVVRRVNSHVEVSVSDDGRGIDPQFLPHIFEPFRQADGSSTRTHGGLGLGLAITRQLVELHGGHIEARSDGKGAGATFVVHLPLAAVASSSQTRARSQARSSTPRPALGTFERPPILAKLRILVVDDDEDAREIVRAILEECGSIVRTAASVAAAIDAFATETPDVLLTDIGMPVEDGYELIRRVRELPASKGGKIPAVALTAYARAEDRRRALNEGFMMHLPKPVDPAELVAVVANLVSSFSNR